MKVNLTYFKRSGKYYSEGSYETLESEYPSLNDIWNEVRKRQLKGILPGLRERIGLDYLILVDVPEHPYNHLRILV